MNQIHDVVGNPRRTVNPHIGCAGWTIPRQYADRFAPDGSHLERYAQRLAGVEINSSFYRPHRRATYERWAGSVPVGFAFAVKAPREITHEQRLIDVTLPLTEFLDQVSGLGDRLGPILFQLPPSLPFDARKARTFFSGLRQAFDGSVVCEPRHPSWFTKSAEQLLAKFRIGRVAADPAIMGGSIEPGGWAGIYYLRLHGTPRMYYSDYDTERLAGFAEELRTRRIEGRSVWCIFDNTAAGAATGNALALASRLAANPI
jgi:uncharacterized protein YecE (DUF72 family)